ncbi:MAG: hypothetical protein OXC80_09535 [Gammaproteobacteria bacterium]|nr:hypothetical protein [Gammaproteobacteria bacterium]
MEEKLTQKIYGVYNSLTDVKAELKEDIRSVDNNLRQKIDAVDNKLTQKIDAVDNKLTQKIDAVGEKLTQKIDGVGKDLNKLSEDLHRQRTSLLIWICSMLLAFGSGVVVFEAFRIFW